MVVKESYGGRRKEKDKWEKIKDKRKKTKGKKIKLQKSGTRNPGPGTNKKAAPVMRQPFTFIFVLLSYVFVTLFYSVLQE